MLREIEMFELMYIYENSALPSQCTKEYNDLLERTFGKRT